MEKVLLENTEHLHLIILNRKDIGPIFLDYLKLTPNNISPFTEILNKYARVTVPLSPEAETLIRDEVFASIAQVLAAPDLLIKNRLGGSMVPFDEIRICGGKPIGQALALVTIGENDSYVIRVFNDFRELVNWWVDSFAGKNQETIANYIPPTVNLEQFLFILHAVDWFKRESYKNALDYAAGQNILVKPEDFYQGMEKAVQSRDMRWLLPAFVMLVPGFERLKINLQPGDAKVLNDMQFFNNTRDPQSQEERLIFGEAGHAMGVEFMRSWLLAAGFELSVMYKGSIRVTKQFFVAPTALANHFVELEQLDKGRCLINHQAYTFEQLKHRLETIVKDTFEQHLQKAYEESTGSQSQASPNVTLAQKQEKPEQITRAVCSACGTQLESNSKFCVGCGTPAPASMKAKSDKQAAYCTSCGQEAPSGSKFCTNCGSPVK
jgi:hypothetical protein